MYCGCNPTALSSQLQISRALMHLMLEKPYSTVSVSELCRAAGVSRPTFYALFSSMENVVLFTLQERACQLPPVTGESPLEHLCRGYSLYISDNRDYLRLLARNDVGYLLYDSIYESLIACSECLRGPDRQYAANFIAGGVTGVIREYCAAEPPPDQETLFRILMSLFSGAFWK